MYASVSPFNFDRFLFIYRLKLFITNLAPVVPNRMDGYIYLINSSKSLFRIPSQWLKLSCFGLLVNKIKLFKEIRRVHDCVNNSRTKVYFKNGPCVIIFFYKSTNAKVTADSRKTFIIRFLTKLIQTYTSRCHQGARPWVVAYLFTKSCVFMESLSSSSRSQNAQGVERFNEQKCSISSLVGAIDCPRYPYILDQLTS